MNQKKPGPVMLDIEGITLNENDSRRLLHPKTGGVILFSRNYQNRKQLIELTCAIRDLRAELLIAVDQEGGRVQRFKTDGFTLLPPMKKIGQLWNIDKEKAKECAIAIGTILGSELHACGIDLSFSPVLDLDYQKSKVIGDRAFHSNPQIVAQLAFYLSEGLALGGLANCAKHFPGHGFIEADTHDDIATDHRPLSDLLAADIKPYHSMGFTPKSIMAAHIIYPKIDTLPAGFSKIWLTDILRNQLHFEDAIFSDDLSMIGARVAGNVIAGAQLALNAGCDMILICNHPEEADLLLEALEKNQINMKTDEKSAARIIALKAKKGLAFSWDELVTSPQYIKAKALVSSSLKRI